MLYSKRAPKVSPQPEHDVQSEPYDQAHLHAPSIRMGTSISSNAAKREGKCARKYGALWRLESVATLPERGRLECTEEKEGEEWEEKADDNAVEHRPRAGVAFA